MLPIVLQSPLPMRRAGRGSRNAGVAFLWGFIFLPANSSDGRLIGCAAPPRTGPGGQGSRGMLAPPWHFPWAGDAKPGRDGHSAVRTR